MTTGKMSGELLSVGAGSFKLWDQQKTYHYDPDLTLIEKVPMRVCIQMNHGDSQLVGSKNKDV